MLIFDFRLPEFSPMLRLIRRRQLRCCLFADFFFFFRHGFRLIFVIERRLVLTPAAASRCRQRLLIFFAIDIFVFADDCFYAAFDDAADDAGYFTAQPATPMMPPALNMHAYAMPPYAMALSARRL